MQQLPDYFFLADFLPAALFLVDDFLADVFLAAVFFVVVFFAGLFFAEVFFADLLGAVFFDAAFFVAAFLVVDFLVEAFFASLLLFGAGGIFAPSFRASDNPIAIACLRLFTLAPLPERRFPSSIALTSRSTDFWALGPYFAMVVLPGLHHSCSTLQ